MAKRHRTVDPETTGAVFIDARVPDLQKLLDGAASGEAVFVLDPAQDGLAQIAADLAGAGLSGLSSISIVSHGAAGSLQLGSTVLDDSGLAARAAALKAIGAALKPKGQLDLYACDVAAGGAGKTFVADLSHYVGGAHVAAATHAVGETAGGENWTLDAAAGVKAAPAASPFKSAVTATYAGSLASGPTSQLYGIADAVNSAGTAYFGQYDLNSDSTTPTIVSKTPDPSNIIELDPVLGIKFELGTVAVTTKGSTQDYLVPFTANINTNSTPVASQSFLGYYEANGIYNNNNYISNSGTGIAVDTADHKIFAFTGSNNTQNNGMLVATYSQDANGNVTIDTPSYVETNTSNPTYFDRGAAYWNGNVYVEDVLDGFGTHQGDQDGLYRISTTGAAPTTSPGGPAPVSILNQASLVNNSGSGPSHYLLGYGVAIDHAADRLYFSTSSPQENTSAPYINTGKLYALNNVDTAMNETPIALTVAPGAMNAQGTALTLPSFGDIQGLTYDENAHVLYVVNDNDANPNSSEIDELTLNPQNGTQVTAVTTIPYSSFDGGQTVDQIPFAGIADTPLPTLTASGTTVTVAKGAPVTLLSAAPAITDITSGGYEQSATVTITDASTGAAVSGDMIGFNEGGTFTTVSGNAASPTTLTDNGHTFLASYSGGVLTIANQAGSMGENKIAAFVQALQDVQYENNSADADTRLVTVQVNNGALGSPSGPTNTQSFDVALDQPPKVVSVYKVPGDTVAGATTTVAAAGPATAPTGGALAGDSDPNGTGLTITAVQTQGGTTGNVGSPLAGSYGSLTLNADGSYDYAANNAMAISQAKTGSHPVDTYTFTVGNAGGSATERFAATIDRAPTGTGITVSAPEGATTSGGNRAAFKNETDADGDVLSVASVSYTSPTTKMTMTGTVGQSITGSYGVLTLNTNGSYSYVANNTPAYDAAVAAGQTPVDDFTYTSTDGYGGTTPIQTLEFDVVCFASGTRIRVVRNQTICDVPVENLVVGDLAVTASGAARPIRWLGHRTIDCRRHPRPNEAQPIRVRAHAFGEGLPARDLRVSPGHALCLDILGEVLVPAGALVDGTTITREDVDTITYWHVELDAHDILLAENMPAESYVDCGNRGFFVDCDVVQLGALPDARADAAIGFCRPLHAAGPVVDAVRARLAARAGRPAAPGAPVTSRPAA